MDQPFTHQILDIGWHHTTKAKTTADLAPYLTLLDLNTKEQSTLPLDQTYTFGWNLSSTQLCIGYTKEGEYFECPFKNPATGNFGQCGYCAKQVGFIDAFFLGGEINPQMQKYLAQPHIIYLAYFQPSIIKVGTAVKQRRFIRTLEQDALVAATIAESDGFSIQAIERAVSGLGYPEGVNSRHKRKFMSAAVNLEKATDLLFSSWQNINDRLANSEISQLFYEINSKHQLEQQLISHLQNPHLFLPAPEKTITYLHHPDFLIGQFRGLRGKYLIFEHSDKLFAISRTRLVGCTVSTAQENMEYKVTRPRTLFD
jgi:hypothetical protein